MPGSQVALMQRLHDEHAPALWAYCVRLTGQDRARAEDVGIDSREQARQSGELTHRPRALCAPGQVFLERLAFGRGQGTEDVRAVVMGEVAGHAPTPISSSASRSARNA